MTIALHLKYQPVPIDRAPLTLTEAEAHAIVEPWYALFDQPFRGDAGRATRRAIMAW